MSMPFFAHEPSPRTKQFRQRHHVRDTIQGELLGYITSTRAWVQIGDIRVVAAIRPGLAPRTKLWFVVKSLYPDIILEEAAPGTPATARYIARFMASRLHFETKITDVAGAHWAKQLRSVLHAHADLLRAYLKTQLSLRKITAQEPGGPIFAYCPWAVPALCQSLVLLRPATSESTINEILAHGLTSDAEPIWIETTFDTRQSKVRYFAPKDGAIARRLPHLPWQDVAQFPWRSPWDQIVDPTLTSLYRATL